MPEETDCEHGTPGCGCYQSGYIRGLDAGAFNPDELPDIGKLDDLTPIDAFNLGVSVGKRILVKEILEGGDNAV